MTHGNNHRGKSKRSRGNQVAFHCRACPLYRLVISVVKSCFLSRLSNPLKVLLFNRARTVEVEAHLPTQTTKLPPTVWDLVVHRLHPIPPLPTQLPADETTLWHGQCYF
jgi:hypothetical protein